MKFTWIYNVHSVYLHLYLFTNTAHWGIWVTYLNLSSLWFLTHWLMYGVLSIFTKEPVICEHYSISFLPCFCFLSREDAIIYLIEHTSPFQLWQETKCSKTLCKGEHCCLGIKTAGLLRRMMTLGSPFDVDFLRCLADSFKGAILSSEFPVPYCHILQNRVLFNDLE